MSTKAKTSPAPWRVHGKRDPIEIRSVADGDRVALVGYLGDAKLIAAAPSLADALQGLLSAVIDLHNCGDILCNCRDNAAAAARAALRAAGRLGGDDPRGAPPEVTSGRLGGEGEK